MAAGGVSDAENRAFGGNQHLNKISIISQRIHQIKFDDLSTAERSDEAICDIPR